jgi:hypothetical protein
MSFTQPARLLFCWLFDKKINAGKLLSSSLAFILIIQPGGMMTMMIQAIRLTRKKAALAVILAGAVLAALILLLGQRGGAGASEQPCLSNNGERVAYLRELGWEIDPEPLTTLQFLLPPKLSGDYITYNDLQKAQGFDLETCCGKQVTRFTYTVTNYPQRPDGVQLNLYICEDLPVAGDVVCTGTDGFQDTLVFPQQTDAS